MSVEPESLLERADWIRRLALHLSGSAADAEDLAQDTLVAALERGPREGVPLASWMAAVARNLAAGDRRGSARRLQREAHAARPETDAAQPPPGEALERLEAHQRLVAAVRALDEPYRDAILMRYFDGLAPRQIARRTRVPVRTIHTRLQRALVRLRTALERDGDRPLAAWLPLLLPAAPVPRLLPGPGSAPTGTLATLIGGLIVETKTKLFVGVACCCGLFLAVRATLPASVPGALEPTRAAEPVAALSEPADARPAAAPTTAGRTATPAPAPLAGEPSPATAPAAAHPVPGRALDLEGRPVAGLALGYLPYRVGDDLSAPVAPEAVQDSAVTDADGAFEFFADALDEALPGGRVVVLDPEWSAVLEPLVARFGYGDPEENLLVVAPATVLAGRVVDEDGLGVPAAELTVSMHRSVRADLSMALEGSRRASWSTTADENGAFELRAVSAAGAHLHTTAGGLLPDIRPAPERSEAWMEILLESPGERDDRLVGTVIDADGLPVEGARVALGYQNARTSPEGRFVLDLRDDNPDPSVAAILEGHLPAIVERSGDSNLAQGAWPDPLILQLGGAPLTLAGRVLDPEGQPAAGLEVQLLAPTEFGPVEVPGRTDVTTLAMVENLLAGGPQHRERITTDRAGRFELKGLLPRAYALRVVDRTRALTTDFGPLEAGTSGHDLRLAARQLIPRLAGRVLGLSGQPVGPVQLTPLATLRGAPDSPGELGSFVSGSVAHADAEGYFEFRDLSTDVTHLSVMGREIGFGHRFAIPPGADLEDLEFRVPARCRFRVELGPAAEGARRFELRDASGNPLTLTQSEGDWAYSMESGILSEGRSEVLSAPETAALLVVQLPDGSTLERPVQLLPDEVNLIVD